jgi:predicted transcriptional regulator
MTIRIQPLRRLDLLRVREAMHPGIVQVAADADLGTVATTLAERAIHCVVVSSMERDGDGEQVTWAIVSALDVMRALATGDGRVTAAELAARELVTVQVDEPLAGAVGLMAQHGITHLVVIDRGWPVGVVSALDVVRAASGEPTS